MSEDIRNKNESTTEANEVSNENEELVHPSPEKISFQLKPRRVDAVQKSEESNSNNSDNDTKSSAKIDADDSPQGRTTPPSVSIRRINETNPTSTSSDSSSDASADPSTDSSAKADKGKHNAIDDTSEISATTITTTAKKTASMHSIFHVSEKEEGEDTLSTVEEKVDPQTPEKELKTDSDDKAQLPQDAIAETEEQIDDNKEESDVMEVQFQTDEEEQQDIPVARKKRKLDSAHTTSIFNEMAKSIRSEFKPIRHKSNTPVERRRAQVLQLRRQRGAAGTLLLLHALLSILLMIVWAILPRNSFGIDKLAIDGALFSTLMVEAFAVLLPSAFIMYLYNMDAGLIIGRKKQSISTYCMAALIGIPAALAFTGLNNISLYILAGMGFQPNSTRLFSRIQDPSTLSIVLFLLITALVPAIAEEVMFRGVIQASLSLSGRKGLSIFLMATAFAIFHNDPFFILAPFVAGLYLGFLREKSDSIYTGMLTHFVMNACLLFIQPILPLFNSTMSFAGSSGRSSLYASLIAAAVAFVTLIPLTSALLGFSEKSKNTPKDPIYNRLQHEQWFPADWKYMLALFILFITLLLVNS